MGNTPDPTPWMGEFREAYDAARAAWQVGELETAYRILDENKVPACVLCWEVNANANPRAAEFNWRGQVLRSCSRRQCRNMVVMDMGDCPPRLIKLEDWISSPFYTTRPPFTPPPAQNGTRHAQRTVFTSNTNPSPRNNPPALRQRVPRRAPRR